MAQHYEEGRQRVENELRMSDFGLKEAEEEHENQVKEPSRQEVAEHVRTHDKGAYV